MTQTCQACEKQPATVIETNDNKEIPYLVCSDCHGRLMSLSLRPLEWYNLAKRHGWWQYHLHDDFYDEDGTAHQPEDDEIQTPELFPAPTLQEVANDPEKLLYFTITRWHLRQDVIDAWQQLPADAALKAISAVSVKQCKTPPQLVSA